jgi:Helix-turn-helix domain
MSELKDPLQTRQEARAQLKISITTLDVAIARGFIKVRRIGSRVFILQSELDRFVRRDVRSIWPEKRDGKTARTVIGTVVQFREAVSA